MPRTLVFDVNETLLDLRALDHHFEQLFGDAAIRKEWFALVLRNAMALTITGDVNDFVSVAGASLHMVADARGVDLDDGALAAIAGSMRSLPPHDDVVPGLTTLQSAGLSMVALTNSPQATADAQIQNAGLGAFFEQVLSVEATGRFKPDRAVYEMAATALSMAPGELRMVAAHDWDIAGAMSVGYAGAYIVRPGMAQNPLYPQPDIVGPDLIDVARKIVSAEVGA